MFDLLYDIPRFVYFDLPNVSKKHIYIYEYYFFVTLIFSIIISAKNTRYSDCRFFELSVLAIRSKMDNKLLGLA